MLAVMKRQAHALEEGKEQEVGSVASASVSDASNTNTVGDASANTSVSQVQPLAGGEVGAALLAKLKILKPISTDLTEAPMQEGDSGKKHYSLRIVAACFEGMADAKREQLVATVIRKESRDLILDGQFLTPDEAEKK